jgi:hypothetical protein
MTFKVVEWGVYHGIPWDLLWSSARNSALSKMGRKVGSNNAEKKMDFALSLLIRESFLFIPEARFARWRI